MSCHRALSTKEEIVSGLTSSSSPFVGSLETGESVVDKEGDAEAELGWWVANCQNNFHAKGKAGEPRVFASGIVVNKAKMGSSELFSGKPKELLELVFTTD